MCMAVIRLSNKAYKGLKILTFFSAFKKRLYDCYQDWQSEIICLSACKTTHSLNWTFGLINKVCSFFPLPWPLSQNHMPISVSQLLGEWGVAVRDRTFLQDNCFLKYRLLSLAALHSPAFYGVRNSFHSGIDGGGCSLCHTGMEPGSEHSSGFGRWCFLSGWLPLLVDDKHVKETLKSKIQWVLCFLKQQWEEFTGNLFFLCNTFVCPIRISGLCFPQ